MSPDPRRRHESPWQRLRSAARALLGPVWDPAPPASPLDRCPTCRGRLLCPVGWDSLAGALWEVAMRCGDCAHETVLVVDDVHAGLLAGRLDRQLTAMAELADRLALGVVAVSLPPEPGAPV